jgi:hypothetical protein
MKTAVLHSQGIEFAFWGVAAVKAAVLGKSMLIRNVRSLFPPRFWTVSSVPEGRFVSFSHDDRRSFRSAVNAFLNLTSLKPAMLR